MSRQELIEEDFSKPIETGIYVIASPIGNLLDLSIRAFRTLGQVDWIAAEDTRVTKKLLNGLEIHKPIISFHEHSSIDGIKKKLMELKTNRGAAAYLSDAGTPGISDPGAELVSLARELGINVIPIPGPSAISCLLSVIGKSASQYRFLGYAPRKEGERIEWLKQQMDQKGLAVFFESPHRVKSLLTFLADKIPQHFFAFGRELTKKYETIYVGTPIGALEREDVQEPLGEYVLVIEFPELQEKADYRNAEDILTELVQLGLSQKAIVRYGQALGLSKNVVYSLALKLKK